MRRPLLALSLAALGCTPPATSASPFARSEPAPPAPPAALEVSERGAPEPMALPAADAGPPAPIFHAVPRDPRDEPRSPELDALREFPAKHLEDVERACCSYTELYHPELDHIYIEVSADGRVLVAQASGPKPERRACIEREAKKWKIELPVKTPQKAWAPFPMFCGSYE